MNKKIGSSKKKIRKITTSAYIKEFEYKGFNSISKLGQISGSYYKTIKFVCLYKIENLLIANPHHLKKGVIRKLYILKNPKGSNYNNFAFISLPRLLAKIDSIQNGD